MRNSEVKTVQLNNTVIEIKKKKKAENLYTRPRNRDN